MEPVDRLPTRVGGMRSLLRRHFGYEPYGPGLLGCTRHQDLERAAEMESQGFCASLTDFFIQEADQWRDEAWEVIRRCNEMDWLILTKRPQLIPRRLPAHWGDGWPHVWLGTTCGVRDSYPRLDALREIPAAVRFISAEPLLESLADINLDGFHWLIAGGESGPGFRPTEEKWATKLRDLCLARDGVGFHFKQHAAFRPGQGHTLCGEL